MDVAAPRLTQLAHGGGCGCKLSPAVLRNLLADMPGAGGFAALLVGSETGDDAAVWRLNAEQAVVATADFFTPIVDDPFDFGQIAATNALSDIYAMGARPVMALALLGVPLEKIGPEAARRILAGGAVACEAAGIPVAGGHSIDSLEPIYGMAAIGLVHPARILRNCTAEPGDTLILTKGLGIGIFSAAGKQDRLDAAGYATLRETATQLNTLGAELAAMAGVHAATDVTGFGLLGHLLEMCRGAALVAEIAFGRVPILAGAAALARAGFATAAAVRNWASGADAIVLPEDLVGWERGVLCDPQTSGGLLIAVAPSGAEMVIARARAAGFAQTASIGYMRADGGRAGITVSRDLSGSGGSPSTSST